MVKSFTGTAIVSAGNGRLGITKKLVLWSVLILQIGFIGCIWLLQMSYNGQEQQQQMQQSISGSWDLDAKDWRGRRVNFVKNHKRKGGGEEARFSGGGVHCPRHPHENVNRYDLDFYQMKVERLNNTNLMEAAAYEEDLEPSLWCYRQGTLNESHVNEVDYLMAPLQCKCASGWHGRDCGQPEIIWRALMTLSRVSKRAGIAASPLQLREASGSNLHRLYYMLELGPWELLNLDLLELQLIALIEVVDYFLIYYVNHNGSKQQEQHQHTVEAMLGRNNASYLLYQCPTRQNCSSSVVYGQFRRQLWSLCGVQMQVKDLLLHGDSETVYAPASLKFLKYYAKDVLPLQFRLKFNVYGFYWQHPQRTLLHGVISSLNHLHNGVAQIDSYSHTLGDLNHFGGWHCQLCLSPEQIVRLLQSSYHNLNVKLPNTSRNAHIDSFYIQRLISNGLYIDGTTQLQRLRQQSEKYYAPEMALRLSSQFGQLLVNLYDISEEEDDVDNEME
ncbi:uncharacterized protein Dwil_GK23725 [Drosophila willistoni]|uniref:Uncharacterized protein n=1 Tax=Drosophila willistoni TaxID=7260 RepID=B4MU28_DROWI|nr:beta-1,4-mannosyl-glycoprotein 4-beta-N-acetylglucosaminyltransferase [Drosophila willistoni]EDW75617.1 uncharacterized protein Dwil_GK23725 [Drosophila willistoni]